MEVKWEERDIIAGRRAKSRSFAKTVMICSFGDAFAIIDIENGKSEGQGSVQDVVFYLNYLKFFPVELMDSPHFRFPENRP